MSRRRIANSLVGAPDQDRSESHFVTALARGLNILSLFSTSRPELTIREIAAITKLPYPTVWRLCHTLETCGYLVTLSDSGKVSPSARALTLGHTVVSRFPAADVVYPDMQAMTARYNVGLSLGTRVGPEMVYLRRTYGSFVALNRSSMPIPGAPTGWAMLAASGRDDREAILAQVRAVYPEAWDRFILSFEKARAGYERDGYLVMLDIPQIFPTSRDIEAICLSVPIRGGGGNEILGLSCAGSPKVLTPDLHAEIGRALLEISRKMAPVHA